MGSVPGGLPAGQSFEETLQDAQPIPEGLKDSPLKLGERNPGIPNLGEARAPAVPMLATQGQNLERTPPPTRRVASPDFTAMSSGDESQEPAPIKQKRAKEGYWKKLVDH